MMPRLFAAVLAAMLAFAGAPAGAVTSLWHFTDLGRLNAIQQARISPDGTRIIVGRLNIDLARDAFAPSYHILQIASGASFDIAPNLGHPRWSPDGSRIAWLAPAANHTMQIVLTDAHGANLQPLTSGANSVVAFAWSPHQSRIAAVEIAPHAPSNARLRELSPHSDFLGDVPPARSLWIVDAAKGTQRSIANDGWSYGGPATDHDPSWSANGRDLVVVRQPTSLYDDFERAQYAVVDVTSGRARPLFAQHFFAYPGSPQPRYAPSGNAIAYTQTWDGKLPSREDLYVDGSDVSARLDRDLWSCGNGSFRWSGSSLLAAMLDGVAMRLYRAQPGTAPRPLTGLGGSVESYSVAKNGRIAYVWATPATMPQIYLLEPNGTRRQLTHDAFPSGLSIARTRLVHWSDGRGHVLVGQLTLPLGVNARHAPLVVEPHGGPQCSDDNSPSLFGQYLASHGYAYFRPDPSGSDGYGDWSYKAIVANWGNGPMRDDLAGIATVLKLGIGDPHRLYIEGGSYGGYLTAWIVTHTNRFRAAIAQVPVTNLELDYTLTRSPNIERRFFGARPLLDPELLREESPLTYAASMHTPLLIIAGLLDNNAPDAQAIEFYKVLAERGEPVRMLVDPKAGHGPDDPAGIIAWWRATLHWIETH
ncbi:MAG: S9 family peptidase [Candidatus Tyrphobacter sp.]